MLPHTLSKISKLFFYSLNIHLPTLLYVGEFWFPGFFPINLINDWWRKIWWDLAELDLLVFVYLFYYFCGSLVYVPGAGAPIEEYNLHYCKKMLAFWASSVWNSTTSLIMRSNHAIEHKRYYNIWSHVMWV